MAPVPHDTDIALARPAGDLRDRLAEAELELATLEAELLAFRADYMREVGTVMARVQDLEARILERSGAAGAAQARAQANRTTAEAAALPEPAVAPTAELKKLFRDAAKQVHPDRFSADPAGHAHAEAFMKRLNRAYRAGDAAAIADLMRQWATSPVGAATEDPETLRAALAAAEERLRRARDSQIARIMEEVLATAASGRDRLAEMRRDALAALADVQQRLAAMESPR